MTQDTTRPVGVTFLRIITPQVRSNHGVWTTFPRAVFKKIDLEDIDKIYSIEVLKTPMQPIAIAIANRLDIEVPETMGKTVELLQVTKLICPCCDRIVPPEYHKAWLIDYLASDRNGSAMTSDQIAHKLETLAVKMQTVH